MLKNIKLQVLLITSLLILNSCTKDDVEESHEHEINKVVLLFTNTADNSTIEVEWEKDHDDHSNDDHGHEGQIELKPNSEYVVEVKFYDTGEEDHDSHDHGSDDDDHEEEGELINPEIIEEADAHHVLFELVDLNNLTIDSASDDVTDSNDFKLNLKTVWSTTAPSLGDVVLYLIHEPQVKVGTTRSEFDGDDDVQATFEVHIEE
jgi:hypothetical protein